MGIEEITGSTEMRINIVKYELVKILVEVVLADDIIPDDNLGLKSGRKPSLPFSIAFNSLLNKKLIKHY